MKKLLVILMPCLLLLFSCEDLLDMNPENSVTFKNAYETENDMEAAVRLCAQKVRENYASANQLLAICVDTIASEDEFAKRNLDPTRTRIDDWAIWYQLVGAANVVVKYSDQIVAPQKRKDYYKGQGLFYRAYAYLQMIRTWGDVVILGDDARMEIACPKSTWTEVIEYTLHDLREAVRLLPEYSEIKDSDGNSPRYKNVPCRGAANAMLAHLCAMKAGWKYFAQPSQQNYDENELWKEAEKACTAIIGSEIGEATGIYRLVATPEEVCTVVFKGNSTESIFEIEYRSFWNEISAVYTNLLDTWALPYHYWLLDMNIYGRGLDCIKEQKRMIRASTVDKMFPKGDLRREAYFWKLDSMSHDTLKNVTGGFAYPYFFRDIRVRTESGVEGRFSHFEYNGVLWRLADIYLLRAECRARLGKTDEAIADLNVIRKRANAALYSSTEYADTEYADKLRYAIFKEREKELLYEAQRYFDIMRNGEEYVHREISEGFRKASLQDMIDGCFFFALDPETFGRNTALRQNTWWHQYM